MIFNNVFCVQFKRGFDSLSVWDEQSIGEKISPRATEETDESVLKTEGESDERERRR